MSKSSNSDVVCPFCGEGGFDLIGLKNHYEKGHCDQYNETLTVEQEWVRKLTHVEVGE